jgi:hypothetical protein
MSSGIIGEAHMKIGNSVDSSAGVQAAGRSGRRIQNGSRVAATEDHVQLSGLLAQLSDSIASQRSARLSELTAAVSAARYLPDAQAVSASIVHDGMIPSGAMA